MLSYRHQHVFHSKDQRPSFLSYPLIPCLPSPSDQKEEYVMCVGSVKNHFIRCFELSGMFCSVVTFTKSSNYINCPRPAHNVFDGDPAHYRDPAHFRDACI